MEAQSRSQQPVRVRIAPSPTGTLHVGTARTALFNYLFAKQHNGAFILRIEDTDQKRSTKSFEEDITESLMWLGLEWDEGPMPHSDTPKGEYGPYRQSERTDRYASYIKKLLTEEKAYHCFCTTEELEAQRQYYASLGKPWKYSGTCSKRTKQEQEDLLAQGKPSIIRFRTPTKEIHVHDLIRGPVEFSTDILEDFSVAKNDHTPLYNLAVVIDDYEMNISHVIRGEDHIPNTPKQILLQEALGLNTPKYAHIPLILAPDRSKLSKRKGAVSVAEYRHMGYLSEAFVNFMALLGWNPGTERELFSLKDLIKAFSIDQVHKSGAIFDIQKLDSLNGLYIRQKTKGEFASLCIPYLIQAQLIQPSFSSRQYPPAYGGMDLAQTFARSDGSTISIEQIADIVSLYQQRVKKMSDIVDLVDFFFQTKIQYDQDLLSWKGADIEETQDSLKESLRVLSSLKDERQAASSLETLLLAKAEEFSQHRGDEKIDRGKLLWPLRVALTGKKSSAPPFEIISVLGKEKSIQRIQEAISRISP